MAEIAKVFEVSVEEAGDYIFSPAGVVIVFRNQQFQVFTESARHNFLRRVLTRHPWDKLLTAVTEHGVSVRLRDVTEDVSNKIGLDAMSTEAVLEACYESNPLQLFFLRRHFSNSPSQANMPPS
ncbi:hypothetical protein [Alicyclobacillus dauci]|uniref:Uncharacterized protein n=1 Tax=Alicyclobacillus dauci TaxID=1475485 RepID=A0ABY6YY40_9BACL|nr:hypothetical protein [Alicyclobacillus dauci]WAH34994.1 hypothetical protein NZD86_11700 [Alicyclobacillus dauci]